MNDNTLMKKLADGKMEVESWIADGSGAFVLGFPSRPKKASRLQAY